ncbi:SDR family NAD(P)-dependent oxidoreductase [Hymenobacter sp. BT523]|nr:SDR family NAD(P)-dependent oxidoreductase [Hymenobacter sp. BT523]
MALATAQLFVEEGAYVFITGRRQHELDEAVKTIGRHVTGVVCDSGNLADLDRLYAQVQAEKGRIDVLYASAGAVEFAPLGKVTEAHFDTQFAVNAKGTFFTVQKAPAAAQRRGFHPHDGLGGRLERQRLHQRLQREQSRPEHVCQNLDGGLESAKHPRERHSPRPD